MKKIVFTLLIFCCGISLSQAQQTIGNYKGDESKLYAETKQFTQFIKRFNNEEDRNGQPYSTGSYKYRENNYRKKYLEILFDGENTNISKQMKKNFIDEITDKKTPQYIEKHQGGYFAEVSTRFLYKGKNTDVTLYMQLEQDSLGYKWSISDVYSKQLQGLFENNNPKKNFLHPMSHEIDFMNLHRAFGDKDEIEDYAYKGHEIDYISILFYLLKTEDLKFVTVTNVRFHIFQIENWYFTVEKFERDSYNSGWLISSLMPLKPEDIETMRRYVLHKK
ncbi:hypothetical protein EI427_05910 [Flammeovirga pectinis]|uniref:Uncharacterized protein n=1 Tax=Flammeovirga pectinis TaxID=2494373 RepID=A0A3S9P0T5_9BACT|nr:hypothetical protein [Flammeovirga pectinis]AZQ61785.1 hypothetical protein EI427_05910 [Flammeovirga pectinis]